MSPSTNSAVTEKLVTKEQLRQRLWFGEPRSDVCYPDEAALLTARYDAKDRLNDTKHPDCGLHMGTKMHAIAAIWDAPGDNGQKGETFGRCLRGAQGGDKPWLKASDYTSSPIAGRSFFVNSMTRDGDNQLANFEMYTTPETEVAKNLPADNAELGEYCEQRSLVETRMRLWEPGRRHCLRGAQPSRPVFVGTSQLQIETILSRFEKKDFLQEYGLLIVRLLSCQSLSIYSIWPHSGHQVFCNFRSWFKSAVNMVAMYGNGWFYHLQAGHNESINNNESNMKSLQVPRWLVKTWTAKVSANNEIITLEPATCASFELGGRGLSLPDRMTGAFELRLAIEREWGLQGLALQSAFRQQAVKIRARFHQHPSRKGTYVVELRSSEGDMLNAGGTLQPQIDTRLKMGVAIPDESGRPVFHRLRGIVIGDLFNSKAEVVCVVVGPALALPDNLLQVDVELCDDPTPCTRYRKAVEQISNRPGGDHGGVDLAMLVLRAPQSIRNTDSLAAEVVKDTHLRSIYDNTLAHWGLDTDQYDAAGNSITSATGWTQIDGPTGCGKTLTVSAIAEGHISVGKASTERRRQVLAVAHSNLAVDIMLKRFVSGIAYGGHERLEIVRYQGSISTAPGRYDEAFDTASRENTDRSDEDEGDLDIRTATWELGNAKSPFGQQQHVEYGFDQRRLKKINTWAESYGQPEAHFMAAEARLYLDLRHSVAQGAIDLDTRKRDLNALLHAEYILTRYYLQNVVDIVFCTNTTSAYGILPELFKPVVLISDEGTNTTLPDAITPMAAFMGSIEHVVIAGDSQQRPLVPLNDCNEYFNLLRQSLFASVLENKAIDNSLVELKVQRNSNLGKRKRKRGHGK